LSNPYSISKSFVGEAAFVTRSEGVAALRRARGTKTTKHTNDLEMELVGRNEKAWHKPQQERKSCPVGEKP